MSTVTATRAGVVRRWEITRQALRASRRTLVIWAASFAGLIALYAVIWPSVRGNTSWRNLFDTLPATYRAMFTASGTIDLSTAGGYLGVELMGFMGPALIAVYAITTGAATIAGEEDRGGLEITLSAPISRIRVFTQRCAGLVIGITILMMATGAALWIFSALLGMGLGVGAIAAGAAALGLFGLFTGAVAIAVGAATGSAVAARGLAALAAVASYLINALAQITSVMRPARPAGLAVLSCAGQRAAGSRAAADRRGVGPRGRGRAGSGRRHPLRPPRPELRRETQLRRHQTRRGRGAQRPADASATVLHGEGHVADAARRTPSCR